MSAPLDGPHHEPHHPVVPGELLVEPGELTLNPGRRTCQLQVANTGDRPIQVGSHYHFAECNRALRFDRAAARGMRLNIVSGTAVRFEPGQVRSVELVDFAGLRRVFGFQGAVQGALDEASGKSMGGSKGDSMGNPSGNPRGGHP